MCMSPARAKLGNSLCPCVASLVCMSLFHLVLDSLDSLFLSVACCSLACVLSPWELRAECGCSFVLLEMICGYSSLVFLFPSAYKAPKIESSWLAGWRWSSMMKICVFFCHLHWQDLFYHLHLRNLQKMECIVLEWRRWHKNVFCFVVCFRQAWRWNLASWMAEYDHGLREPSFWNWMNCFFLSLSLFLLNLDGMLFAYMMGHCWMTWEDVLSLTLARCVVLYKALKTEQGCLFWLVLLWVLSSCHKLALTFKSAESWM